MTTAKTPHRPLGLQSRMHPWLGPLIDLRTMGDQGRGYAQLVGLVQQAIPAQAFTTAKGKTLVKASVKVGDESRSYFDVTLWKRCLPLHVSWAATRSHFVCAHNNHQTHGVSGGLQVD
eukprot:TRINITY_DN2056_c0_g4_i2.p2 TRINITY_DN2056_c0_g4~~TRINITY_DN2056_c0_g4_i2.p2  ORF type:complete len:118 (-),score=5.99 TRINITY_DN2056_c0_g4_i2:321-674(-)